MHTVKRSLIIVLTIILAFGTIFSLTASAAKEIILTVEYKHEEFPIPTAEFDIYKIADTDEKHNLYPLAPFDRYALDFSKPDSERMHAMAFTLASYIARDGIEPYDTGVTNENGITVFPNNVQTLTTGLYLIIGHNVKIDDIIYATEPFLAYLPDKAEDGTLSYSVIARPKSVEKIPDTTGSGYQRLKVLKIWDDDNSATRPAEITVDLIKDGAVYETVVLNAENNWRHTWNRLSFEGEYYVAERDVPDGYTVLNTLEGITFTVTNKTKTPPETTTIPEGTTVPEDTTKPEETTKPGDTTVPSDTTKPSDSTTTTVPTTDKPSEPSLPQTGMVQWPIPYLACAGLVLFMIGWVKNRKSEIENEI